MLRFMCWAMLAATTFGASIARGQSPTTTPSQEIDPNYWFERANEALERRDRAAAIEPLKKLVALVPNDPDAWHNLGQAYQAVGKPAESNEAYAKLIQLEPDNWRARSKIVQNYQALGDIPARDRARDEVFAMNEAGKVDQKFYCREQFKIGANDVMVFEYFALEGDRAKRYSFRVIDPKTGESPYTISLGSYDMTTEHARAAGTIKLDERLFHLDGYYPKNEHRTYGFFKVEPTYEKTRAMAVSIIEGKRKEISSSKPGEMRIGASPAATSPITPPATTRSSEGGK